MPSLRDLLASLGPVLRTASSDLDREVDEVLLIGPGDPLPEVPTALLVVVDSAALDGATVRAAGIVVKDAQAEAVTQPGLPVLTASDELSWHQLLQLLGNACVPSGSDSAASDLFALANAIAAMVGGAVVIEDAARRVLAYSALADQPIDETRQRAILGRRVPGLPGDDARYRDLTRARGVVHYEGVPGHLPRLAVAVRSGAEVLGSIWVVEHQPLEAPAEQALLDAARLAAVHLLRSRADQLARRQVRGELLRALLGGTSAPDAAAARLGLNVTGRFAVLAFACPAEVSDDTLDTEAVADLVQVQAAAVAARSCVTFEHGTVVALVPADRVGRDQLHALAAAVVSRARQALRVTLTGAVGATVPSLHAVHDSFADADALLQLVPPGEVASVEQLLPQVTLLEWRRFLARHPRLRLPDVDRMLAHDEAEGTPYAESVLAYLGTDSDIAAAAELVGVHSNTFRYRLKRIRELFGIDLEDADQRLVMWLQLRAGR